MGQYTRRDPERLPVPRTSNLCQQFIYRLTPAHLKLSDMPCQSADLDQLGKHMLIYPITHGAVVQLGAKEDNFPTLFRMSRHSLLTDPVE